MAEATDLMIATPASLDERFSAEGLSPAGSLGVVLARRWRTLLVVTFLAGTVSSATVWFFVHPEYQVSTTVHVAPVVRAILFSDQETDISRQYLVYVATQAQALASPAVIQATLALPEVTSLPMIRRSSNPAALISGRLLVEPVRGTELLSASMTGKEPDSMVVVLNSLVGTYLRHREDEQRKWDEKVLSSLRAEQAELDNRLDVKTAELRELAARVGSNAVEPEGTSLDVRLAELQRLVTQARRDFALAEAKLNALAGGQEIDILTGIPGEGLEGFRNRDPQWLGLAEQLKLVRIAALDDSRLGRGPEHREVATREERIAGLEAALAHRESKLREEYREQIRSRLDMSSSDAQMTIQVLDDTIERLAQQRAELAKQQMGLKDAQDERDRLEQGRMQVRQKIWNVQVEQNRAARVTVDSPAVAPAEPNVDKRMKYLALTGVMSLFLGIGAAFTRHRLDSNVYDPVEVIDRLGMPLLGSVQNLPGLNGSAITRDDRLLESMRVISTALISPGRPRQPHSRLITSPTRGVGKSTVASHLARSLAVTDRRVLLIDADNYGQSSTRQFGMSRAEGLKEFLEGKLPQNKVVQPGPSDNLYILPAGERIGHFGELLARQPSQERIRSLFAAYDEVILDSPPVLASSVAIVLATLVDDIVLVLRAGKSTQEEVRAARQHLLMVGGRIVGAVLNGVDGRRSAYAYPYEYGYQVDDG